MAKQNNTHTWIQEGTREHNSRWIVDPTARMYQRLREREVRFSLSEPVRFTPYIKREGPVFLLFHSLSLSKTQTQNVLSLLSTFSGNLVEEEMNTDEGLKIPAVADGCTAVPESKTSPFLKLFLSKCSSLLPMSESQLKNHKQQTQKPRSTNYYSKILRKKNERDKTSEKKPLFPFFLFDSGPICYCSRWNRGQYCCL